MREDEAVDVVKCKRLRVVVMQIMEDLDENVIDEAVDAMAKECAAKYAVHAVPVDESKTYALHVTTRLEDV